MARAFSTPASSFNVVIDRYVKLFADAERQWQSTVILHEKKKASAKEEEAAPKGLADPAQEELRKVLYGNDSPLKLSYDQLAGLNNNRIRNQEGPYLDKLVNLQVSHPGSPKRAMALMDQKTPKNATILIKGSPNNRGAEVPRQFLEILSGPDRRPFSKGSGRLELAKAIASKDNPLTARVFVNRVCTSTSEVPSSGPSVTLGCGRRIRHIPNCWTGWPLTSWRTTGRSRSCTA